MYRNEYPIKVDMKLQFKTLTIEVVQNDTKTNYLMINLSSNNKPINIEGSSVCIRFIKPNGDVVEGIANVLDGKNGIVEYMIGTSEISLIGIVRGIIVIYGTDGERGTSTTHFKLVVKDDYSDDTNIPSTTEFPILTSLITQNQALQNEETIRVASENERTIADNTRKIQEEDRKIAEQNREQLEQIRINAEDIRINSENSRIINETSRETQENIRKNQEIDRINSESIRKSSEDTRKTSEDTRQTNENTRENNEIARQDNEVIRQSSETQRQNTFNTNEATRQSNETTRINSEITRVSSETTRQTNETSRQQLKSAMDTLKTTLEQNETTRQTNETTRIGNEDFRIQNESKRLEEYEGIKTNIDVVSSKPLDVVRNQQVVNPMSTYNYVGGNVIDANKIVEWDNGANEPNYASDIQIINDEIIYKTEYGKKMEKFFKDIMGLSK